MQTSICCVKYIEMKLIDKKKQTHWNREKDESRIYCRLEKYGVGSSKKGRQKRKKERMKRKEAHLK